MRGRLTFEQEGAFCGGDEPHRESGELACPASGDSFFVRTPGVVENDCRPGRELLGQKREGGVPAQGANVSGRAVDEQQVDRFVQLVRYKVDRIPRPRCPADANGSKWA